VAGEPAAGVVGTLERAGGLLDAEEALEDSITSSLGAGWDCYCVVSMGAVEVSTVRLHRVDLVQSGFGGLQEAVGRRDQLRVHSD
jgi:hypothetical protein